MFQQMYYIIMATGSLAAFGSVSLVMTINSLKQKWFIEYRSDVKVSYINICQIIFILIPLLILAVTSSKLNEYSVKSKVSEVQIENEYSIQLNQQDLNQSSSGKQIADREVIDNDLGLLVEALTVNIDNMIPQKHMKTLSTLGFILLVVFIFILYLKSKESLISLLLLVPLMWVICIEYISITVSHILIYNSGYIEIFYLIADVYLVYVIIYTYAVIVALAHYLIYRDKRMVTVEFNDISHKVITGVCLSEMKRKDEKKFFIYSAEGLVEINYTSVKSIAYDYTYRPEYKSFWDSLDKIDDIGMRVLKEELKIWEKHLNKIEKKIKRGNKKNGTDRTKYSLYMDYISYLKQIKSLNYYYVK